MARGAINHDDYNGLVEKTSIDFLVFNVVFVLTSIQRRALSHLFSSDWRSSKGDPGVSGVGRSTRLSELRFGVMNCLKEF